MPHMANTQTNDFSKGSVAGNILRLALPMTVAQLINVLYSVVDRMYIGRLPDAAGNALTGLGLTFPILSIVTAFANLFGMGGSPLFSIQRGKGDRDRAQVILGNTFALLVGTGVALTVVLLVLKRPLLYAFGASDATYPYADGYLTIYLLGSVFVMISLGMNQLHQRPGLWPHGYADGAHRRGDKHPLGPGVYLRVGHGRAGGGLGHHPLPVPLGGVGGVLPAGEESPHPPGAALHAPAAASWCGRLSPWAFPALSWPSPTPLCRWPAIPPCRALAATCTWV